MSIDGQQVGYTYSGGAFTFTTALATAPSVGAAWSLLTAQDGVLPPASQINVNQVPGSPATFTITSSYIYFEEGLYPVTVSITDTANSLHLTMKDATFEVSDQPLVASTTPNPISAGAGASTGSITVGTFTDDNLYSYASYSLDQSLALPSDYTASIYWGDGQTSTVPNSNIAPVANTASPTLTSYNVTGSHTYAKPGTYKVQVTVHDGPETVYIKDTTITVTQSSTLYAGTTPTENLTVAKSATWVVGTFYDSNLADVPADFSGTIAWGDSSSNLFGKANVTLVGTVVNPSGLPAGTYNEFTVTGTHAYSATGTYAVNVTINDIGAVSVTATSSAIVNYTSGTTPLGSSHDSYISGVKGSPATLNSATFTDASKAPASDFIVTAVNWGDPSDPNNTSTAGLTVTETSPGNYLVSGEHAYPGPGTFPYSITVENTLSGNFDDPADHRHGQDFRHSHHRVCLRSASGNRERAIRTGGTGVLYRRGCLRPDHRLHGHGLLGRRHDVGDHQCHDPEYIRPDCRVGRRVSGDGRPHLQFDLGRGSNVPCQDRDYGRGSPSKRRQLRYRVHHDCRSAGREVEHCECQRRGLDGDPGWVEQRVIFQPGAEPGGPGGALQLGAESVGRRSFFPTGPRAGDFGSERPSQ